MSKVIVDCWIVYPFVLWPNGWPASLCVTCAINSRKHYSFSNKGDSLTSGDLSRWRRSTPPIRFSVPISREKTAQGHRIVWDDHSVLNFVNSRRSENVRCSIHVRRFDSVGHNCDWFTNVWSFCLSQPTGINIRVPTLSKFVKLSH